MARPDNVHCSIPRGVLVFLAIALFLHAVWQAWLAWLAIVPIVIKIYITYKVSLF